LKKLLALLLCCPLGARAVSAMRDVPYNGRQCLDIYAAGTGHDLPVMLWVHGGGWTNGDKSMVDLKPEAFNSRGYLLVSVDYALVPSVNYREQVRELAQAIAWVHQHIAEYGGSGDKIYLMGHSAGAHLVAMVSIDDSYLRQQKLDLGVIKGSVLLDGAAYDVATQMEQAPLEALKQIYVTAFGSSPAQLHDASPVFHVAAGKSIPPFLIVHVSRRSDSAQQSQELSAALRRAGVKVEEYAADNKSHRTLNREFGQAGDPPTAEVFRWLSR
jgi:arylformamidase